jgi:RNA polymerase sigma-B factor
VATSRATKGRSRRTRTARGHRDDVAALRAYARDRDPATRERLVCAYLPLARAIAKRFDRGGSVPLEDLEQVAAVGLLKALERFDPDKGAAFSSFAVPTIQGEIRRYYRDFTWAVRPPRDLQEKALRLQREREHLTNELQRSPTAAELAARVEGTAEDVVDALLAAQARSSDSLDTPIGTDDGQGQTLADTLGQVEPGYAVAEASATAHDLLGLLSERDALVVRLRFHDDLTQREIGERVGCSQMHVSRILRNALAALQSAADRG